jgi:hypothetical protein
MAGFALIGVYLPNEDEREAQIHDLDQGAE